MVSIPHSRSHRTVLVGVLVLSLAAFAPSASDAMAKAPPLATTVLEVNAYAAPDYSAPVVAVLPADAEVELTGNAAPGFLGIIYGGQEAFVPAQFLSLGTRPGIDAAVATVDAPLLEAPMPDADALVIVPEGASVILTGASVDGYDAASYELTGGWIERRRLAP